MDLERIEQKRIKIISPEEKDMSGITKVFYEAWLDTYPNKEVGVTREDIEHKFKDRFKPEELEKRWEMIKNNPEAKMFIAKDDDMVVGVAIAVVHPDSNQLQAIYILPEYQGKNIGGRLWKEAKRYFDQKKKCIVHVATYNKKAIGFYEKIGFKDNGKRWTDEKTRMKSGSIIPEMEMELNF